MLKIILCIAFMLLPLVGHTATPVEQSAVSLTGEECVEQCVEYSRVGAGLVVLWKGKGGQPVKSITVDLPLNAVLISEGASSKSKFSQPKQSLASEKVEGSTLVTQKTYTTKTEIVVIVTTMVYRSDGTLLAVYVNTHHTPLPKVEK